MSEYVKAIKISESVYWVGAIDWAIRDMHGYSTPRGTTYNAYLIMADKITLIDTVKKEFKDEMLSRIKSVVDPGQIDYVVSNHAEMDHSGALPQVLKKVKPEKLFASPMGVKALKAHFKLPMEPIAVKTGDEISLGNKTLSFIETRMLHWPDSMFSYLREDEVLFSQDAFGMHLGTSKIFVDENSLEVVEYESEKYYANILMPMAGKITKLLDDLAELNLAVKVIASDHGPIWRKDFDKPIDWYRRWSEQAPVAKAMVLYDTMWGSTASMAKAIADGVKDGGADYIIMPVSSSDRSQIATEVINVGALIVGSPTLNNGLFPSVADILTYLRGLKPKNLIGFAFGSSGWSDKSVGEINKYLADMGVDLVSEGLKARYVPDTEVLQKCYEQGKEIGRMLKERASCFS